MAQIRITLRSLRTALKEASDADDPIKKYHEKNRMQSVRTSDSSVKPSETGFGTNKIRMPVQLDDSPEPLTPEEKKNPELVAKRREAIRARIEALRGQPKPASAIKTGGRPIKQPPASRPITKDYVGPTRSAPYLTSKDIKGKGVEQAKLDIPELPISLEEFEKLAPTAFSKIPHGSWAGIVMKGGYNVLKPKSSQQKPLIWASVPPKGDKPGKIHAWRTLEELPADQRAAVGYIDTHERGMPKSDVKSAADVQGDEHEFGLRVKFKGDPAGRVEPETMGPPLGAATGKGGTPAKNAQEDVKIADAAAKAAIPDWDTLPLATLERAAAMAERKFKSSRNPEELQIMRDINDALFSRQSGEPPAKAVKTPLPKRMQRKDVRDVIRAFEAEDYERASAYLGSLPFELRVGVKKLLDNAFPGRVNKLDV